MFIKIAKQKQPNGCFFNSNINYETVKDNLISTLILIAGGFDMTISEFLDSPLFNEENLNI